MQLALTEEITLVGLRQQAERLHIPDFATMRKLELVRAILKAQQINHAQTSRIQRHSREP